MDDARLTCGGCFIFLILKASWMLKYSGIANAFAHMLRHRIDEEAYKETLVLVGIEMFCSKYFSVWIVVSACAIFLGCWLLCTLVAPPAERPLHRSTSSQ